MQGHLHTRCYVPVVVLTLWAARESPDPCLSLSCTSATQILVLILAHQGSSPVLSSLQVMSSQLLNCCCVPSTAPNTHCLYCLWRPICHFLSPGGELSLRELGDFPRTPIQEVAELTACRGCVLSTWLLWPLCAPQASGGYSLGECG